MIKVAIATLGCKVNTYDSAEITGRLKGSGCTFVPHHKKADICIVNTCTVTHKADYQSRQTIRKLRRLNPSSKIIVTGCYAKAMLEEIEEIPDVDHIVGVGEIEKIIALINSTMVKEHVQSNTFDLPVFNERTRAFLKIQDGCDSFCSYCIVPYARGRSRSISIEKAMKKIIQLVNKNHKEIVLTGIHLGAFGCEKTPGYKLADLLKKVEEKGIVCRIRLSSIEPMEFDKDLIRSILLSKIICNHLHIPLQSGDNEVLRRMGRPYNASFFKTLIEKLASVIPDLNVGLDVIAGFPGESEENFNNTMKLIEGLPIAYLHVFPFSRRRGTPAAEYKHQVESKKVKKRAEALRELGWKKKKEFYERFIGRKLLILLESKRDVATGYLKGLSRNYIPVLVDEGDDMINEEIPVIITKVENGKVFGRMETSEAF